MTQRVTEKNAVAGEHSSLSPPPPHPSSQSHIMQDDIEFDESTAAPSTPIAPSKKKNAAKVPKVRKVKVDEGELPPIDPKYLLTPTQQPPTKGGVMHVRDVWERMNVNQDFEKFIADNASYVSDDGKEGYRAHPLYIEAATEYAMRERAYRANDAAWVKAFPELAAARTAKKEADSLAKKARNHKRAMALVGGGTTKKVKGSGLKYELVCLETDITRETTARIHEHFASFLAKLDEHKQ